MSLDETHGLPLLLRVRDAALALSLSERRVYQLIAANQLELVRIGAASRITRASLLELASNIGELGSGRPQPAGAGGDTSAHKKRKQSAAQPAKAKASRPPDLMFGDRRRLKAGARRRAGIKPVEEAEQEE